MIRSTITRPTSIAATSSCDTKISLIETIDIGPLHAPKPRVISLEPISKRHKKATKSKTKSDLDNPDIEDHAGTTTQPSSVKSPVQGEPGSPSIQGSGDRAESPRSPVNSDGHSEASGESVVSSSTGMSFRLAPAPSSRSARDSQGDRSSSSLTNKTITATIELLKAGCLAGDSIPLRISIQHTKRIKSMHGIIITLYRQGRIDSAPPLSMFTDIKGKAAEKLKHEEYYPKSKTGLGGLSLTSAGSSSVFRKDLSQTFAPIIIDPATLSTVVNTSIRIPDDVFPTITGVPGQMISFRYNIEVVIDLGGKLAGTSRHLPKLGMINAPTNFSNNNQMLGREDGSSAILAAWGGSIVDTDHIRREKSVVACLFEVVVGTSDSARVRGRKNTIPQSQVGDQTVGTPLSQTFTNVYPEEDAVSYDYVDDGNHDLNYYDHTSNYTGNPSHPSGGYDYAYAEDQGPNNTQYQPNPPYELHPPYEPIYVPPPDRPREEGVSEKEQIRRAEERLLPSQPPQEDGPSSSGVTAPSAPPDPTGDIGASLHIPGDTPTPTAGVWSQPLVIAESSTVPSAPALEDLTPQATNNSTDDKQELERRRLMAEASSPSDFPEDHENAGEGSSAPSFEPTAPVLTEEEEYGDHPALQLPGPSTQVHAHEESLPKYER